MGKLLKILGVNEEVQKSLPEDVYKAEKFIDALQQVYANAPESPKKNQLALAISEAVRILMAKISSYKVEEKKEEKIKEEEEKLPEEPKMPEQKPQEQKPQEEKPKKAEKPEKPKPPKPEPPKPQDEEEMTCEEIKEAIVGLTLLAKMGDDEAKEIIKQLKNKRKNQNCK